MSASLQPGLSSEQLERNAEVQRIARLLSTDQQELAYLSAVSSEDLRALREQVTSLLFDDQSLLAGLASASKLLPASLNASLGEKVFGALLCARIAGLLEPDRAVELASRLPQSFLADVAVQLDPRRVAAILAKIPPDTVGAITKILIEREEWVAMGQFYAFLPDASIAAALAVATPISLLRIALVLDDKSRLSHVLKLAGVDKVEQVRKAAEANGLAEQAAGLSDWLSPEQRTILGL
ncbi:MAG: hypothetical protein J2O48_11280 [Solirubrobacterales bacterium]|nr:hypothetical protein [Solirubrobacterales bacterium]